MFVALPSSTRKWQRKGCNVCVSVAGTRSDERCSQGAGLFFRQTDPSRKKKRTVFSIGHACVCRHTASLRKGFRARLHWTSSRLNELLDVNPSEVWISSLETLAAKVWGTPVSPGVRRALASERPPASGLRSGTHSVHVHSDSHRQTWRRELTRPHKAAVSLAALKGTLA